MEIKIRQETQRQGSCRWRKIRNKEPGDWDEEEKVKTKTKTNGKT